MIPQRPYLAYLLLRFKIGEPSHEHGLKKPCNR